MPASYPSSAKTFTTKSDGAGNTILAAHINDLQLEVTAIETDLLAGLPIARGGTGAIVGGLGSWTPVIGGSGGTSGQVYTTQVGRYLKLGGMVFCQFRVQLSTLGTITGNAQIQGLPFTSENTTNLSSSLLIGFWQNLTTSLLQLSGELAPNSTAVTLRGAGSAVTALSALAQADLSNTTYLDGFIAYRTV
jgi:hypothetical protein